MFKLIVENKHFPRELGIVCNMARIENLPVTEIDDTRIELTFPNLKHLDSIRASIQFMTSCQMTQKLV